MTVRLLTGDCREVLATLPDASVQCCITSPPYFGLRDYGTASWQGGDAGCDHLMPPRGGVAASGLNAKRDENGHLAADRKSQPNLIPYAGTCGKCGATRVDQQIGLESTVDAYVEEVVAVFREVRRVLRSDGCLFLNLGDSYAGSWGNQGRKDERGTQRTINGPMLQNLSADYPSKQSNTGTILDDGLKPKDLIGIPWRVAFALQADGWYLRSDIIWAKPNPMPESVRDRPTKSHEYIFLLTKSPRYFWDAEGVKETSAWGRENNPEWQYQRAETNAKKGAGNRNAADGGFTAWQPEQGRNIRSVWTIATDLFGDAVPEPQEPAPKPRKEPTRGQGYGAAKGALGRMPDRDGGFGTPDSGRNIRSVWEIATAPYAESHFATFPPALAERCIKAGTSEKGACSACGAPWVRVVEDTEDYAAFKATQRGRRGSMRSNELETLGLTVGTSNPSVSRATQTTGWQPTCPCDAPSAPCVVLDPFGGAGTVSLVAERLSRDSIYVDLSPIYAEMARKRIYDDAPMFAAVQCE